MATDRSGYSNQKMTDAAAADTIHSNLVREQHVDFDELYEIVELIGEGSISNISKIKRKESAEGGSSRPDFVHRKDIVTKGSSNREEPTRELTNDHKSHPTEYFALKEIDLSFVKQEYIDELHNELEMLKSFDHPNIIKAYETFRVKKRLAIVLELCSGGDLYTRSP